MKKAIIETIADMSLEQLLVAAQMEGIAVVGWDNHLHLQAYVFFHTLDEGKHRYTFMVDEARQIVDFPDEARTEMVRLLTKELTRDRDE